MGEGRKNPKYPKKIIATKKEVPSSAAKRKEVRKPPAGSSQRGSQRPNGNLLLGLNFQNNLYLFLVFSIKTPQVQCSTESPRAELGNSQGWSHTQDMGSD